MQKSKIRMDQELQDAVKAEWDPPGKTKGMREVFWMAVLGNLPEVVRTCSLVAWNEEERKDKDSTKSIRIDEGVWVIVQAAAKRTGIPASMLLAGCLRRYLDCPGDLDDFAAEIEGKLKEADKDRPDWTITLPSKDK